MVLPPTGIDDKIKMASILLILLDEIVKSHFSAWIPAFAGMTAVVSVRY
jgi:hypothetical protein